MNTHADYLEKALNHKSLIEVAAYCLPATSTFDTFVGCGLSGTIAASVLATHLNKKIVIVRKKDDIRNHSQYGVEGVFNQKLDRMVIVDDLVCSGATLSYIVEKLVETKEYYGSRFQVLGGFFYDERRYQGRTELPSRGVGNDHSKLQYSLSKLEG